jgi:hypothetical protein
MGECIHKLTGASCADNYKIKIKDFALFVRNVQLSPAVRMGHVKALEKTSCKYSIRCIEVKVDMVPRGPSMLSGTWIFCYRLFSYLDVPVYPCTTWLPLIEILWQLGHSWVIFLCKHCKGTNWSMVVVVYIPLLTMCKIKYRNLYMLFAIYIVPPKPTHRHIYICGNTWDEDHFTSVCPTEQMENKGMVFFSSFHS